MRRGSPPMRLRGVAHRGQIHHRGHAGEVLHEHPRRHERDLLAGSALVVPGGDRLDVVRTCRGAFVAERVLEQQAQAEGKRLDRVRAGQRVETIDGGAIVSHREGRSSVKGIEAHCSTLGAEAGEDPGD